MHAKSARDWLTLSADAKILLTQVDRLQRFQTSLSRHTLPALAAAATVASFGEGIVVIGAASGAVAHKLRLVSTSLLEEFKKLDQEVTKIRVVVQGATVAPPKAPKRALLPVTAVDPLRQLAAQLPDSPLKTAVARLANRRR